MDLIRVSSYCLKLAAGTVLNYAAQPGYCQRCVSLYVEADSPAVGLISIRCWVIEPN
jgi:hypothetical protein